MNYIKKAKFYLYHKTKKHIKKVKLTFFPRLPEEPEEVIRERQVFYSKFIKPNDLIFDIGANVGNRIRPFINIGAKVVAVEPQKECQRILKLKFGNRIKIVPIGLGDEDGVKDFFVSRANIISSFSKEWIELVKESRFKDCTWANPIKVKITTLDKVIEKYGLPKFIKIDVEGYELEVLKGLTHAVEFISFEYTVPEQIQRAVDCVNQIEKYNSQIECNYSSGESMEFVFKNWISAADFKNYISSQEFIFSGFGDIYIRKNN